jgi:hypothetical protein
MVLPPYEVDAMRSSAPLTKPAMKASDISPPESVLSVTVVVVPLEFVRGPRPAPVGLGEHVELRRGSEASLDGLDALANASAAAAQMALGQPTRS